MYSELSPDDQLLLAIEFHLSGYTIPQELIDLLGDQIIKDITTPVTH